MNTKLASTIPLFIYYGGILPPLSVVKYQIKFVLDMPLSFQLL